MENSAYSELDRQWRATCRILFGSEVGPMKEYEAWLSESLEPMHKAPSFISGKGTYAIGDYSPGSSFASFDEIDMMKKAEPLSINALKDIDSLISAVRERAVYAGNIVLGNSQFVEKSTGLEDCAYAYSAHTNHSSQYLAYFSVGRVDRCLFGCSGTGESSYSMRTQECWKATRCFETNRVWESAGVYYSHGLRGCSDCMFSFNLKGKRNIIGNVQLTPEKYFSLKAKLLAELADELEKKKRLPHLIDLFPKSAHAKKPKMASVKLPQAANDLSPIEKAFEETCQILFGNKLRKLSEYENYLFRHVRKVLPTPSCLSKQPVYGFDMVYDREFGKTGRLITFLEQESISATRDWPAGIAQESFSLKDAAKLLEEIAYYCPEIDIQSSNMPECASVQGAHDGWMASRIYFTKFTAYSFWPRDSDHVFGCDSVRNSSFLVNCYNSYKLTRCFEADTSQSCTGSYFIHNCENVQDSMFCFNAKNLRYAIGNFEVGREEYLRVKKLLLGYVNSELERKGGLDVDIYSIGTPTKTDNRTKAG